MIEDITIQARGSGSEILLQHSTGEITVLLFNDNFPIAAKEYYMKSIHKLLEKNPDLSPSDDLFGIFSSWFMRCHLNMPLGVGTYRDMERERLGKQIRQIREEEKIEAKKLAELSGVDAANICRIEQGKYSVGFDVLSKIANALGYRVELVKFKK